MEKNKREPIVKLNCMLPEIINIRHITVSSLSAKSNVSRNTIHTYMKQNEDGSYPVPTLDRAYAIADALGLSVSDIWIKMQ